MRPNPKYAQQARDALAAQYDLEAKTDEDLADLGLANIKRNPRAPGPEPGYHLRQRAVIARKRAAVARRKVEE